MTTLNKEQYQHIPVATFSDFYDYYNGTYEHEYLGDKYLRHEVTIYNDMLHKGKERNVVFQTGIDYIGGDIYAISPKLELSYEGGCDCFIIELALANETFIEQMNDEEAIEFGNEFDCDIESAYELRELKMLVDENCKNAQEYFIIYYNNDAFDQEAEICNCDDIDIN